MAFYKIHALTLHAESQGAAVILPDVTSQTLAHAPEINAEVTAGNSSPTHVSMVRERFLHTLQTYALVAALDALGTKGLFVESTVNPGVTAYLQKYDDIGNVASGSVHRSLNFKRGIVVPTAIDIDNQGHARLSMQMAIVQKTGNDPVIIADNVALPTITIASERWALGPIDVAGVTLANFMGVRIDFGNVVESHAVESNVYDNRVAVHTTAPRIEITGIDPTWFVAAGIPIGGKAATHANTLVHLRHRTQDGSHFVGSATPTHIKFTLAGLAAIDQAIDGGVATRPTDTSLIVVGAVDGSGNDPLIVDTTSTHP